MEANKDEDNVMSDNVYLRYVRFTFTGRDTIAQRFPMQFFF